MRIFTSFFVLIMVGLLGYAVWDLKLDGGFTQPPVPRDQLAESSPEITKIMNRHKLALSRRMSSEVLPQIDESLKVIEVEYGETSPEMIQALSTTALMLSAQQRTDLAEDYMARAAEAARSTYGQRHRETALIQHDLANLKLSNAEGAPADETVELLDTVVETRRTILGPAHTETIGAEISLADALYSQWAATDEGPDSDKLARAAELVSREYSHSSEDPASATSMQVTSAKLLHGRVAFAQEDYQTALDAFDATLTAPEETADPQVYLVLAKPYSEQIMALRATGREDEADALRNAISSQLRDAAAARAE